ncbi:MAG: 2-keto-4-pentenoate hydratase, partial [Candidatus Berkiella sp.]
MKLATLKTNQRDGQLIVVSQDLTLATKVPDIAMTFQQAIDNWDKCERPLKTIYNELNEGKIKENFPFDANKVHS